MGSLKTVIIEMGAVISVPSVRRFGEQRQLYGPTPICINPRDPAAI